MLREKSLRTMHPPSRPGTMQSARPPFLTTHPPLDPLTRHSASASCPRFPCPSLLFSSVRRRAACRRCALRAACRACGEPWCRGGSCRPPHVTPNPCHPAYPTHMSVPGAGLRQARAEPDTHQHTSTSSAFVTSAAASAAAAAAGAGARARAGAGAGAGAGAAAAAAAVAAAVAGSDLKLLTYPHMQPLPWPAHLVAPLLPPARPCLARLLHLLPVPVPVPSPRRIRRGCVRIKRTRSGELEMVSS